MTEQAGQVEIIKVRTYTSLDKTTFIGIGGAIILIMIAVILGGSAGGFIDVPSILIVILGTGCLISACFPLVDLREARKEIRGTLRRTSRRPNQVAMQLVNIADIARKRGVLSLQNVLVDLEDQPLLQMGLELVVDGSNVDEVSKIVSQEISSREGRQEVATQVLKKGAELAPAMGLIGTLVGLVQMLGNLDNPDTIGPSMAVALLTTFYGACMANMIFTPLASKMERNMASDEIINELYLQSLLSIARQENPRRLEMLINSVLPLASRISYFD